MADKKDESQGSKSTSATSPKKPKPILDLKATEVRGAKADASKPAAASNLKGAPGWKPAPGDDKSAAATRRAASATSSQRGRTRSATPASKTSGGDGKPGAGKAASAPAGVPAGQTSAKTSGAPTSGQSDAKPSGGSSEDKNAAGKGTDKAAAASAPEVALSAATASGNKASRDAQATGAASSSAGGQSASPPAQKSGGGFLSTLSHLAAGIVGGAIVLVAAQPLEQEFGVSLMGPAKLPASVEQRIAALETKAAAGSSDKALRGDLTKLSGQVSAAQERLAALDALRAQVAALASDVKQAKSANTSAPASGANKADGDAVSEQLGARLAKLESSLATLSLAKASGVKTNDVAAWAQFSSKFADLEGSVTSRIDSLRKTLLAEMENRSTSTSNTAAKAVAGAERLDRAVGEIKTDAARLEQRATVLKVASDKLAATMRAVSEQVAQIRVDLDALNGAAARPADIKTAIGPVASQVAALEKHLGSVLARENVRKENAERVVLLLELANLKRVLQRGAPFSAELADVKKVAGTAIDFGLLEAHQGAGVPSSQELVRQFRDVAYKIIRAEQAPADGSRINRLFAAAKSIVQVRRTDVPADEKTAEAVVARIEKHLKDGDMRGALNVAATLPDKVRAPAKGWLRQLAARADVDRAIAEIEGQLKASFSDAAAADKKG